MAAGGPEGPIRFAISLVPATSSSNAYRSWCAWPTKPGSTSSASRITPTSGTSSTPGRLIPALIAETERISFFTDVANLPLRPPAVMAKAAASLDVLSGGRFELGLGVGGLADLISNFGGPRRTPASPWRRLTRPSI